MPGAEAAAGPLSGRRALVTGAGVGIGRAIALACARAGADVVLHHYDEAVGAESAAAEMRALGRRATVARGDFRALADVRRVADQALAALGAVDLLINNAGITATASLEEATPALFDTLLGVNLRAGYFLTQHLAPAMAAAGGGSVLFLASMHAYFGVRDHSLYAASKGALVALTRQLAVELADRGVRVNGICPGSCAGENQRGVSTPAGLAAEGRAIPAGRMQTPEDIAGLAVFLASAAGEYFLGETVRMDGGFTARMPGVGDFRARQSAPWGERYVADTRR